MTSIHPILPRLWSLILFILVAGGLGGCASTTEFSSVTGLTPDETGLETVLMPLDVELSLLTAGGMREPKADWTQAAKEHMLTAIKAQLGETGSELIIYSEDDENDPLFQKLAGIERLHSAVGQSILIHEFEMPLPSKKDTFSWTLGPDVQIIRERYDADYALFIYLRDSYSTAGRVLLQAAVAALAGIMLDGGQQMGFASLVDLRNGNIVWFNRLLSLTGDVRNAEPAAGTVSLLLNELPR